MSIHERGGSSQQDAEHCWPPNRSEREIAEGILAITEELAREVAQLDALPGLTIDQDAAITRASENVRRRGYDALCDLLHIDRITQALVFDPHPDPNPDEQ